MPTSAKNSHASRTREKPLFKYMKRVHAEAFFASGNLRIGTLFNYRNTELHGHRIGDTDEGLHHTQFEIPNGGSFNFSDPTPEAEFWRKYFDPTGQRKLIGGMKFEPGAKFNLISQSTNYYIYCTSGHFSKSLMTEFECDVCVKIKRPKLFFDLISSRIGLQFVGLETVTYIKKKTDYLHPHSIHPAKTKGLEYRNQNEWRAIWDPPSKDLQIEPLNINVPEAVRMCKVIA